jgi:hypothetical protein
MNEHITYQVCVEVFHVKAGQQLNENRRSATTHGRQATPTEQ